MASAGSRTDESAGGAGNPVLIVWAAPGYIARRADSRAGKLAQRQAHLKTSLFKDNGTLPVEQNAVLYMRSDGARQHEGLDITAHTS